MRFCLDELAAAQITLPFAESARAVLEAAVGRGHGPDDFAALIEVLEADSGTRL